MMFLEVVVWNTLLVQIGGAKINYFDANATRFCDGEVWETSVLGEFVC